MIKHIPLISIILIYIITAYVYFKYPDQHIILGILYLGLGVSYWFELRDIRKTIDIIVEKQLPNGL